MLYSPLEQFEINNYFLIFPKLNLYFNNVIIYILLVAFLILLILKKKDFIIIKNNFNYFKEYVFRLLIKQYSDVLTIEGNHYNMMLISLFIIILIMNIIGLIPYSFTITSQIIITFIMSFIIILGITIKGIKEHNINFIKLFIPSGLPKVLIPFIFIIELISYLSRIISLSVRLTANMISGHILLYIISSFGYKIGIIASLFLFIPIIMVLYILELGVSIIQAYVFTILTATYIKDGIKLH